MNDYSLWNRLNRRQRVLVVVAGALIVALAGFAFAGWAVRAISSNEQAATVDSGEPSAGPATAAAPSEADPEPAAAAPDEPFDAAAFQVRLDRNGMAQMPVTTRPAEAAVAAAAIAWNVDYAKLTRQEFLEVAASRMTMPSPDYRGPDGEVDTRWGSVPNSREVVDVSRAHPREGLLASAHTCGLTPERCNWWWSPVLSGGNYDISRQIGAVQRGTPLLVMSQDEMQEWDPRLAEISFSPDLDRTPDTEGATLTYWWVLTATDRLVGSQDFDAATVPQLPAFISIWCDAPEDGGVCGVENAAIGVGFPDVWPLQSR